MTDLFEHAEASARDETSLKPASRAESARRPTRFGGLAPRDMILFAAAAASFVWGAWVTKTIAFNAPDRPELVQLQLQGIIGEYLQAQARSDTDEQAAARETAMFMAALDQTVSGLGKDGKIVLLHEAVVGGELPDVTEAVKAAVYAKVPRPQSAQALATPPQGQAGRVEAEMQAYMAANGGE
ncbi:MAG: TrbI F-type domain-containing protein [Parvularcula sp.]|jgi:hypothetical protein|nr:TrbI F-type domain-containing protein [Parvularcula sp.]